MRGCLNELIVSKLIVYYLHDMGAKYHRLNAFEKREALRPKCEEPRITAALHLCWCPGRDSNPHALKDTWPSTMPVYQFQHLGGAKEGGL